MTFKSFYKSLTIAKMAATIAAVGIVWAAIDDPIKNAANDVRAVRRIEQLEQKIIELEAMHEIEMQNLIDTLKFEITLLGESVNVLTGIVSSNMFRVDTLDYVTIWNNTTIEARLRLTLNDDIYVFIDAPRVGQRGFKVDYNNGRGKYTFTPFNGIYTFINPQK